ncbi:hypothetical protein SUDANB121_05819 [Nocardiopsis dassonvillei]
MSCQSDECQQFNLCGTGLSCYRNLVVKGNRQKRQSGGLYEADRIEPLQLLDEPGKGLLEGGTQRHHTVIGRSDRPQELFHLSQRLNHDLRMGIEDRYCRDDAALSLPSRLPARRPRTHTLI